MDKDEKLGFEILTEDDLICKDCAFRGNLSNRPVSKCEAYPVMKPMPLILGHVKDCTFYRKDSKSFK